MSDASFQFLSYLRSGFAATLTQPDTFGAAQPALGSTSIGVQVGALAPFSRGVAVYGPGDVIALDPRQVIRTDPVAGSSTFEPNYFVQVEFDRPDLPWLFSPSAPVDGRLRPWMVLVVVDADGPAAGRLLPGAPLQRLSLTADAAAVLPDLSDSHLWAHAQVLAPDAASVGEVLAGDPRRSSSRLLCARRLQPLRAYLAAVVPAFRVGVLAGLGQPVTPADEARLEPAWQPGTALELPVYHAWNFRTGEADDFEALVRRLRGRPLPEGVGRRALDLSRPGAGLPPLPRPLTRDDSASIEWIGGALRPIDAGPPPRDADAAATLAKQLTMLLDGPATMVTDEDDDPIVAPPIYGDRHARIDRLGGAMAVPPWVGELNLAPSNRVAAALGTQVVQRRQEDYVARAWRQLGDVLAANRLLRAAQLARSASLPLHGRLSRVDAPTLFGLTAPAHARLLAVGPGVAERVTLARAITRSRLPDVAVEPAFRRLARPASAAARAARSTVLSQAVARRFAGETFQPAATGLDGVVAMRPAAEVLGAVRASAVLRALGDAQPDNPGRLDVAIAALGALRVTGPASGDALRAAVLLSNAGAIGVLSGLGAVPAPAVAALLTAALPPEPVVPPPRPPSPGGGGVGPVIVRPPVTGPITAPVVTRPPGVVRPDGMAPVLRPDAVLRPGGLAPREAPSTTTPPGPAPSAGTGGTADDSGSADPAGPGGTAEPTDDGSPVPRAAPPPVSRAASVRIGATTTLPAGLVTVRPTTPADSAAASTASVLFRPPGATQALGTLAQLEGGRVVLDPTVRRPIEARLDKLMRLDDAGWAALRARGTVPAPAPLADPSLDAGSRLDTFRRDSGALKALAQVATGDAQATLALDRASAPLFAAGSAAGWARLAGGTVARPAAAALRAEGQADVQAGHRMVRAVADALDRRAVLPDAPPPAARPGLDLDAQRNALLPRIDPRRTVAARVRARLDIGVLREVAPRDDLDPVMATPRFRDPMWMALRDLGTDWLLPGLDRVPPDTATLVRTHPAFVAAHLVGLNHEFMRELLWREYPTDQRGTAFRHFWGRRAEPGHDIGPVHRFAGALPANLAGGGGDESVLLLRSELLRRYPGTLVYLSRATRIDGEWALDEDTMMTPSFRGDVPPDVFFAGFPVPPEALRDTADPWWFVLAQPPAEPRFGLDEADPETPPVPAALADLSWLHMAAPGTTPRHAPGDPAALRGIRLDGVTWGASAAVQAHLTYQRPVRVAIRARDLLPPAA